MSTQRNHEATKNEKQTQRHRDTENTLNAQLPRPAVREHRSVRRRRDATRATGLGRMREPTSVQPARAFVRSGRASRPAAQAGRRTEMLCVSVSLWPKKI